LDQEIQTPADQRFQSCIDMGDIVEIHRLVTEGYDQPFSYPEVLGGYGVAMRSKLATRKAQVSSRHTLFDTASVELKKILNDAEAHVKKMKPWQRSVPWNG